MCRLAPLWWRQKYTGRLFLPRDALPIQILRGRSRHQRREGRRTAHGRGLSDRLPTRLASLLWQEISSAAARLATTVNLSVSLVPTRGAGGRLGLTSPMAT